MCEKTLVSVGKNFVLAGDAIVTVSNGKGDHYTFRVTRKEASENYPEAYFVKLLTGSDNTSDYSYLGMLDRNTGAVRLTKKSAYNDDTTPVKVVRWAFGLLWTGRSLPEGYVVHHEGYCGRCRRMLTTPESVERGIGPECAKIMRAA